jgi:hypothetical protein
MNILCVDFWSDKKICTGSVPFCNRTTRNCVFSLDTTRAEAQNPGNFSELFPVRGTQEQAKTGKIRATYC